MLSFCDYFIHKFYPQFASANWLSSCFYSAPRVNIGERRKKKADGGGQNMHSMCQIHWILHTNCLTHSLVWCSLKEKNYATMLSSLKSEQLQSIYLIGMRRMSLKGDVFNQRYE